MRRWGFSPAIRPTSVAAMEVPGGSPREPVEPRQPQGRLVRLGRSEARRLAAEQLAQQWRDTTVDRMADWGFNTIGAWSDREGFDDRMAQTPVLSMGEGVSDFFSDALEQRARSQAQATVAPRRDAPWILGWFTAAEGACRTRSPPAIRAAN